SMFKQAINYIENIRSESKRNLERPDLAQLNQAAFAQNRSEELFSRLLDEVLAHYTILSESKGLLYRRVYKLSSVDGQDEPILGSHENEFREVLQNGAKQAGWGKSVIVNLPALQQDGNAVIRSLNLHELINALPAAGMSTAAKVGLAVGGAAAIGAAAYGTYNYLQQPGVSAILPEVVKLEEKVEKVEKELNLQQNTEDYTINSQPTSPNDTMALKEIDASSYKQAAQEFANHLQELEQVAAANPNNQAVQEELAQAQGIFEKIKNGDLSALAAEDYGKIGLGVAGIALGATGGRRILQQRAATRTAERIAAERVAAERVAAEKNVIEDITAQDLAQKEHAQAWTKYGQRKKYESQIATSNSERALDYLAHEADQLGKKGFQKLDYIKAQQAKFEPEEIIARNIAPGGAPKISPMTNNSTNQNLRFNANKQIIEETAPLATRAEQNAANRAQTIQVNEQENAARKAYVEQYSLNNAAALQGEAAAIESQGATFAQKGPWYERSIENTTGLPKGRLEGKRVHSSNIPSVNNNSNVVRSVDSAPVFGYPSRKVN
ncbi:MAG: hypothetical protein ACXWL5_04605, partial [Candidatus Chromulinivorax sp.]